MWATWLDALDTDDARVVVCPPAEAAMLAATEDRLGLVLPDDLRSLLAETDGVVDDDGGEPVWAVERIAEENEALRRTGSTPAVPGGAAGLLFFGDTGGDDLFAYRLADGVAGETDVYVWGYRTGATRWVASDLYALLDGWFGGGLDLTDGAGSG